MTASDELRDFIREAIRERGAVSFAWFMEQALYHPRLGYYSSGRCAIGRSGDYFTSVSVGPLFGRFLAAQFVEVWEKLGRPNDFVIVEQGAHHGEFARDVLETLRETKPDLFAALRYRIIEPFPILRDRQQEQLRSVSEKMEWNESTDAMEPFCGVHFSNELLDCLPVHLLVAKDGRWHERFVRWANDQFAFLDQPLTSPGLEAQVKKLPSPPNDRYETEINLAALDWISLLAPKIQRGIILLADYGFTREQYYGPTRTTGTLQSYAEHRVLMSPLEQPGASDLTTHVEWTSLAERAEESGLTIAGFTDQHHFLTGLLASNPALAAAVAANSRALQTLLHPEFLGTRFQFLGLTKSCDLSLGGFQFAHQSRRALGLSLET